MRALVSAALTSSLISFGFRKSGAAKGGSVGAGNRR
jgi:hypothetical protein